MGGVKDILVMVALRFAGVQPVQVALFSVGRWPVLHSVQHVLQRYQEHLRQPRQPDGLRWLSQGRHQRRYARRLAAQAK